MLNVKPTQRADGTIPPGGNYQLALMKRLKLAYEKLNKTKQEEQDRYNLYYDKSHKDIQFEVGAKVMVLFDAPAKGFLVPRSEGPYTIEGRLNKVSYRVENEERSFAVHVQRMIKHFERKSPASSIIK